MKKTHIVLLVFIAACISLAIAQIGNFSTYENFTTAMAAPGKEFNVVGVLDKTEEPYYDGKKNANYFAFYMLDKEGKKCRVVYAGAKPNGFEHSEQIVLTGSMQGSEFHASHILMKCPSKYINDKLDINDPNVTVKTI